MGELRKKTTHAILGIALVAILCAVDAGPHVVNLAKGIVPPPRTTTGLREVVANLMAATPLEFRVDSDNDTLYDSVEKVIGTDPNNTDTDFDGLSDYTEIQLDSDPLDPDTNSDGLSDYNEVTNVPSLDINHNNITNIWDNDNDGDGVSDGIDASPFAASILNASFHFNVQLDGKPTYITLQFRPRNAENLKLYYQTWDWPNDSKGSMKDLDGSLEDLKVIPQLNITVNVKPNQADVANLGILVTNEGMYVPVYPVWENDDIVAFSAQIFYNVSSPLTLSMDAGLIWRALGYRDEKAKAFKANNGHYVSANTNGAVVANATDVSTLEKFQWIEVGEDKVALKLKDGPYLSLASNGFVMANGYEIGKTETFRLLHPTNTSVCLEAANGKCVAVTSDGTLIANGANTTASAAFELVDEGCLCEWTILASYHDVFMLTSFTISETYGTELGLFYSPDEQQTLRANLLMGYDFLRNSTTHVSNMPSILSGYSADVSSLIGSFSTCDEALVTMSNTMLPTTLDLLPGNQTLPVIMTVEERAKTVEMSEFYSGSSPMDNSYSVNMTAEPFMTTKTLKLNYYNTTGYQALEIDDILRHISTWTMNEEAKFNAQSLVLAWNTGEQSITVTGVPDLSGVKQPEWFVAFPIAFESMMLLTRGGLGLMAYKALKNLMLIGWNSAAISRILKTGSEAGGFTLWAKMCQKLSEAREGFAGLKGLSVLQKVMKGLDVLAVMVDVGLSILTGFLIADQIGGHLGKSMGASFGIVAATYAIVYAVILYAIGEIPLVGWIIDLAIALADIFGGFSNKFTDWLNEAFGPKDDAVVDGYLEDIGMPSIQILDKDMNGLDVGDRITVELNTTSKVNVTGGSQYSAAQSSWYRPYISIDAPIGSFSNTSATGVPSTSAMNTTTGYNWKVEQYETGAWIEPGVGMPNFPVSIKLNIDYYLRHDWHHWVLFVPCYHHDPQQGTTSTPFTTAYYDVLPETIDDFCQWRGVTPLDHDGDGIADVNETSSNPFRYDTDADGLNDKYETKIGLNPKNFDTDMDGLIDSFELTFGTNGTNKDTDGDGLPDYQELSGYLINFNYLNDSTKQFQMRVFSDPRVDDTDGDGIGDYMEYLSGLNPRSADTDGDTIIDVANPRVEKSIIELVNTTIIPGDIGALYDIAVDKNGYVYIFGQPDSADWSAGISSHLWIYDSNFTLVSVWNFTNTWDTTHSQLTDCISIDDKNGLIHIANYYLDIPADYADRTNIKTFYLNGTQDGAAWASKTDIEMWQPLNFDVDLDGNVYVARSSAWFTTGFVVYIKAYVDEYAANRSLLKTWGSYGLELDKFTNIRDIAVDTKYGRIYVADDGQNMTWLVDHPDRADRVAVFDTNGNYIRSLNGFSNGTLAIPFNNPTGVDVDSEGNVYVVDSSNYRIDKFDPYGIPIASWGGNGTGELNFTVTPRRVAVDGDDNVYVMQSDSGEGYSFNRISKFSQSTTPPEPLPDDTPDRDGDGLLNTAETAGWDVTFTNSTGTFTIHVTSDPMLKDTDFDGLSDDLEYSLKLNPRSPDTDNDGVPDLTEYQWHHSPGMNPTNFDTDGDGLDDATELAYGSNPTLRDTDGDGLSDLQEFRLNTNPANVDTDGDGLSDYQEVLFNSNPLNPDADGDFMFDGAEYVQGTNPRDNDTDHDNLLDGQEILLGTAPLNNDTDGDNLTDGVEVGLWLNPLRNDTDGDGVSDSVELKTGTDPWLVDSDFDGVPDNGDHTHIDEVTEQIMLDVATDVSQPATLLRNCSLAKALTNSCAFSFTAASVKSKELSCRVGLVFLRLCSFRRHRYHRFKRAAC